MMIIYSISLLFCYLYGNQELFISKIVCHLYAQPCFIVPGY
jgi:hypothetical protein